MNGPLRVVFAGGGTGGHLFPGIAVAEALKQLRPESVISFVGSKKKIESRVVPRHGYAFDPIWIAGFARRFSFSTLLFPAKLLVSLIQSASILRKRRPHVVIGTGGYVSGPIVYIAAKLGRRTLIHEQNEYPGVTTRALAPLVDEVHITFPTSSRHIPRAKKTVLSGNPVRPSLRLVPQGDARKAFGLSDDAPTVLFFGGSLGASSINAAVRTLLPQLAEEKIQAIVQTGPGDFDAMQHAVSAYPRVAVRPFIDDMSAAYSAATLVVCRAGATSLAELTGLGRPSILIPYPFAAADHQTKNARALEAAGAAVLLEDSRRSELAGVLLPLLRDASALERMSARALSLGKPRASFDIAEAVIRLSTGEGA